MLPTARTDARVPASRDDVFGNKGDDTLGVQDEEASDFVNCGEGGED